MIQPLTLSFHVSIYQLRNRQNFTQSAARLDCLNRSFMWKAIELWNQLPLEVRNLPSLCVFKNHFKRRDKPTLYYFGERFPAVHHARMRIGCSKLQSDLCFNLHVSDNPLCHCGTAVEDAYHYLVRCPLFAVERNILANSINHITTLEKDVLLYGSMQLDDKQNKEIFSAVHQFIVRTNRFEP